MTREVEEQLSEFVATTKLVDIPKEVVDFTKGLALKTVAGILHGASMPTGRKIANYLRGHKGTGDVGVMGCGFKTTLWEAVLGNSVFSHVSELEDDSFIDGTAWDIAIFPVIFPLAQKLGLSGKEILEASIVGLEAHSRTSMVRTEQLGMHLYTATIGSAATAARALGLNSKKTYWSFGMAMSGPHGSDVNLGTDAHYVESALQNLDGLIAAELAKEGLTGNAKISRKLHILVGGERTAPPEKMVDGLGKKWLLKEIWVKKYPCCFGTHRFIDAFLELVSENRLSYEQIEKVQLHRSKVDWVVDRPDPKTIGDLQFSLQHVSAAVMLDKDVNFNHFTEQKIQDPRFKEARSKVEIIVHPEWRPLVMVSPAQVVIKLKDGRELSRERTYSVGSPKEPLEKEQFDQLYHKFTCGLLREEQIKSSAEAIFNLENLNKKDVKGLNDLLTSRVNGNADAGIQIKI